MPIMTGKRKNKAKFPKSPWITRLAAVLEQTGWTQEACAEKLGISRRAFLAWRHGDAIPDGGYAVLLDQFCRFPENF